MLKILTIPVTSFEQNCNLIWCAATRRTAITDPGGDTDRIVSQIEEHKLVPEKILITHAHIDHAGAAGELATQLEIPIEGPHEGDQFWIDEMPQHSRTFGMPGKSFTPDRWLHDGDTVTFGEVAMQVYHCPGHSPGHVIFYQPEVKIAIVGDVLFKGSIGRTDFPQGDLQALIQSITEKLWPLGDDVTFIPGHGPVSTFGDERANNPFVGDRALGHLRK